MVIKCKSLLQNDKKLEATEQMCQINSMNVNENSEHILIYRITDCINVNFVEQTMIINRIEEKFPEWKQKKL